MATKYDRFHFGDVVVNRSLRSNHPAKIGMVTHIEATDRNDYRLYVTDNHQGRWAYSCSADQIEIVGRGKVLMVCP